MSFTITAAGAAPERQVVARAMLAGLWIWPSFVLLDAYMCFVAYPGAPFGLFVAYRILIELLLYAVYRAVSRESLTVDRLFQLHGLMYLAAAVTVSLMAIHLGGIRSPYMHGVSIVALVWGALVPTRWQKALPVLVSIALAFPVVIGIASAVSLPARAEWLTSESLIVFTSNYVFVAASSALAVILTHMVWSAQQQARTFGSYQLETLLGRGGMGEVWRARHRLLARRAAIKLVRPEVLGGDARRRQTAVARFEREAQATAYLRSGHTVALYDFGVSDAGIFYCVMELLEGLDADALVRTYGPLPADRVVYLLLQICDSLAEAHAAGLIHRDIKPSNIHICRYGRAVDFVKVLDFGLVKPRNAGNVQLTSDQIVSGTPAFMSPEQALGDSPIDARSDLYALGCVAYWLLTGQHVFEGDSGLAVMMQHVKDVPVPPSTRTELPVPAGLEAIIMRCLDKDPVRRPQSADDLADLLRALPESRTWSQQRAQDWWNLHQPPREPDSDQSGVTALVRSAD
jgi:serine/threonine-protein kinase